MKVGDYVAYKFHYLNKKELYGMSEALKRLFRGKIVDKKIKFDGLGNSFNIFFVRYINGIDAWELEEDLIEIDWLLESL